jgi:hypothetical protein
LKNLKKKEGLEGLSLMKKAEMAMNEAAIEAIAEHKRLGHPIWIWRDGKVVKVPPEEIVVPISKEREG